MSYQDENAYEASLVTTNKAADTWKQTLDKAFQIGWDGVAMHGQQIINAFENYQTARLQSALQFDQFVLTLDHNSQKFRRFVDHTLQSLKHRNEQIDKMRERLLNLESNSLTAGNQQLHDTLMNMIQMEYNAYFLELDKILAL